jgi:hypothetical protein
MKVPEKPPGTDSGSEGKCGDIDPSDEIVRKEIEDWRNRLARNIALRNHNLESVQLNTVVHKIINGLIFLRICENRGIERPGILKELLTGDEILPRLMTIFEYADSCYGAGLFSFNRDNDGGNRSYRPDSRFDISDSVLKEIIMGLYRLSDPEKKSPSLSPFPLCRIYEQVFTRSARLHGSHQVMIEDTADFKRAGITGQIPHEIKQYMVKKTCEELVAGINPVKVSKMRILDPACGSGTILGIAFQYMLDWHLDWYTRNLLPIIDEKSICTPSYTILGPEPHDQAGAVSSDADLPRTCPIERSCTYGSIDGKSSWKLTLPEKKRILLNTIFGVDLDPRAVAVTRFLLLLHLIMEEDEKTIAHQRARNPVGLLPDLKNNIKCGNSIIGEEYFNFGQSHPFNFKEQQKINPFDWNSEFPEILRRDGFDAVIVDLPFISQKQSKDLQKYLQTHYSVYTNDSDLYPYFIEKSLSLIRAGGKLSAIIPDQWLHAKQGRPLRRILKDLEIEEILDFPLLPESANAVLHPCIIRVSQKRPSNGFCVTEVRTDTFHDLEKYVNEHHHLRDQRTLGEAAWVLEDQRTVELMRKLQSLGGSVEEYVMGQIYPGITTGCDEAFIISENTKNRYIEEDPKSKEIIRPLIARGDIHRYQPAKTGSYLIFIPKGWTDARSGKAKDKFKWLKKTFPVIARHFEIYAEKLEARAHYGDYWWELPPHVNYLKKNQPILIIGTLCPSPACTYVGGKKLVDDSFFVIPWPDLYLLGILNSKLTRFICLSSSLLDRSDLDSPVHSFLERYPVYIPDFDNPIDIDLHNRMDILVSQALNLANRLSKAGTECQKATIGMLFGTIDSQIDELVYKLYRMNDEEIRIIEESVK